MALIAPVNLKKWIDDNRRYLKPPVGNKLIYEDADFIVMAVGGPNRRTDYHIDPGEEFFYQIEGDMVLKVIDGGKPEDIVIGAGEIFLLPAGVPHSPQRGSGTVGLVIERKRLPGELDGFAWYCRQCGSKLYDEFFQLESIVGQLPAVFERFYAREENCICKKCGTKIIDPSVKEAHSDNCKST